MLTTNQIPIITTMSAEDYEGSSILLNLDEAFNKQGIKS
jgi:hypothetical protein